MIRHTSAFLLALTAFMPVNAQKTPGSFGSCSENVWGFVNIYDDTKSIPAAYCSAGGFSEGLIAVKKGEKWGYIDVNNNVVIDFQFDYARSFKRGRAIVRKDDFYGVINKKGKYVVPSRYYDLTSFELEDTEYYISRDSTFFQGIIDTTGKEVLPHQYTFVIAYDSNLGSRRFYENIPFYATFQAIDTTKGTFYEQFKEDARSFYPEKGRQDIYDLQFNRLASRNSANSGDGFPHEQLRRIDNFLTGNTGLTIAEKLMKIDSLLHSPGPDGRPDSTPPDTAYLKYRPMSNDEIKDHLAGLGYVLFTNGEGKTGLKKGDSIIIPAQYAHLELVNAVLAFVHEDDISFLQESYGGTYRNKEKSIIDIFYLMVSNNTAIEMSVYNLSGKKILSLHNQRGIAETTLAGITPVGFKYLRLVKDSSDQSAFRQGLVNWKGKELLPPLYQSIHVTKSGELLVKQTKAERNTEGYFGLYGRTGTEIIPTGIYSTIEAFPQTAHLFLATRSEPPAHGNKTRVILKIKNNTAMPVNTFTANFISRWALDAESGMLPYRKNITSGN